MQSSHTTLLVQVRATSRANKLQRLGQDIKDAVIDLWHHPQVAQAALHNSLQPVALHLQVIIDIHTLKPKHQSGLQSAMEVLCGWLKTNGVTYEFGYVPVLSTAIDLAPPKNPPTHQLVLSAKLPAQH